jgi:UDP-N-acetylglucosamine/UDP-N-acetylgalactosamine diphosphorylase
MDTPEELATTLKQHGQEHLLAHARALPDEARARFLAQIAQVDWEELQHPAAPTPPAEVTPSRVLSLDERAARAPSLTEVGEAAYQAGQVAVLMVAGGQGTRLGTVAPKGCYPLMPLSHKTIYQVQAEKVWSLSRRLGRPLPFLVMTSPATDAETRSFFAAHGHFDLPEVRFFCQGTVPSLDERGRALLARPGELLTNPDGHGGCFTALVRSGELARLAAEGIRHIVYLQVDNILAPADDPFLVGLCEAERADLITKVLEKAHPDEKVGHLLRVGGRDRIIEYTELTPEDVRRPGPDGAPLYRWGSPAMHCFSVDFLVRLARRGYKLPLHRSRKPLHAYLDDGEVREVQGYKSERFIFDLVPEAERHLGLAIRREEEFAPIKNATGADSPATAVALASDLYARWLRAAGVRVSLPEGAHIEISPRYAATEAQFLARFPGNLYIEETGT